MKLGFIILSSLISLSGFARTVTLMNYNAENLFDTVHDEGKEDYTYLPLALKKESQEIKDYCNSLTVSSWRKSCLYTDWNEEVLNSKIKNLSRTIRAYNKGRGADIVVLQEVENKNVLNILVNQGLKGLGYKYISLIEGPDKRGIDVGILSKFPVVSERLHQVDLGNNRPTRGILETTLSVDGKTITILGNHWPSQHNPSEHRLAASEKLKDVANNVQSNIVIATGDFNTKTTDVPNGVDNLKSDFINVETQARLRPFKRLWRGTHWYRGEWTSLDKIFIKRNFRKVRLKFRSFKILSYKFLLGDKKWTDGDTGNVTIYRNVPFRFSSKSGTGYSDHLPIAFKFKL